MSAVELDVSCAGSSTSPASVLRSPLASTRSPHKRSLTLAHSASLVALFSSAASPITPTRQSSSPPSLSHASPGAAKSDTVNISSSVVHSTSLRSLYRRISSRLPSSSADSLGSSSSSPMLSAISHKSGSPAADSCSPLSSPTATPSHLPAPLPLATLRLLAAHSTYLATISTHISMLSSFLYLVLNLLKSSYHSYRHSVHVVVWCDVLLVCVNLLGVGCAIGYWCSYAERRRYEWELEQRRTGKVLELDAAGGVEGEADGYRKGQAEEYMDEEDIDITEAEAQSLLKQYTPASDEAPSIALPTPTTAELYPFGNLSSAMQHLFSAFLLTLFFSHTFYVANIDGVTELLSLSGAFLYFVSSLFPLMLDTHIFALQEETEASLDELGYVVDSLAMALFVVSSLLYLLLYARDRTVRDARLWLDGGFWSNVWNVGGSLCYLFAIAYGLSIRLHMSAELPPPPAPPASMQAATMGVGLGDALGLGLNSSLVDDTVAADDLSDLSEWQRALFGLRSGEKLMTSTGDLMYMMCAVMMEIAERQSRRRRARKANHGVSAGRSSKLAAKGRTRGDGAGIAEVSDAELSRKGGLWGDGAEPAPRLCVFDTSALVT